MKTMVKKWGNSAAVRIPAAIMQASQLAGDEVVEVREEASRLIRGITARDQLLILFCFGVVEKCLR